MKNGVPTTATIIDVGHDKDQYAQALITFTDKQGQKQEAVVAGNPPVSGKAIYGPGSTTTIWYDITDPQAAAWHEGDMIRIYYLSIMATAVFIITILGSAKLYGLSYHQMEKEIEKKSSK